jgi:preprotein translocase subunit SecD
MAFLNATLTLPGIAGIILTIGMGVDSNVLMFERIREELRSGKSPRAALDIGYDKAFAAIFDSNLTTVLSGLVLLQYGTGPVRGFAVTLCIGIFTTMFSAVLVSRALVNLSYGRQRKVASLSVYSRTDTRNRHVRSLQGHPRAAVHGEREAVVLHIGDCRAHCRRRPGLPRP